MKELLQAVPRGTKIYTFGAGPKVKAWIFQKENPYTIRIQLKYSYNEQEDCYIVLEEGTSKELLLVQELGKALHGDKDYFKHMYL